MIRNYGVSSVSPQSGTENPSGALLLGYWRQYKALRANAENVNLPDEHRLEAHRQAEMQKQFLFSFYKEAAIANAKSHWRQKVPKKSLMTEDDSVAAVLIRMWDNMDVFDPDYYPESEWLRLGSDGKPRNLFMMWFNSSSKYGRNKSRLVGALQDEKRRLMNCPRDFPAKLAKFNANMAKLRQKIRKQPTLEEYLDEYGWDDDNYEFVSNSLLHSQVFSQSNAKPGEQLEQELRFNGDRRRQEPAPLVNASQAIEKKRQQLAREKKIMEVCGDKIGWIVIAYWYWRWNIPKIAEERGSSAALISKMKKAGEDALHQYFGSREAMLKWIHDDIAYVESKPVEPENKFSVKTTFNFMD